MVAALLATLSWSLAPVVIRLSIGTGTNLSLITGIRAFSAFIILLPLSIISNVDYIICLNDLLLILVSGFLVGLSDLFYIDSIRRLGSWRAILVSYQYILIAQVLAFLLLKEFEGIIATLFTPIALLGLYIALKDDRSSSSATMMDYLIAYIPAILWGIATVLSKYLTTVVDVLAIATYRSLFITLIFTVLGSRHVGDLRVLGIKKLVGIMMSGFLTHVGGFTSFLYALRFVGTFISTLTNSLGPLLTQVISSRVCGEELRRRHVLGALIITYAIVATLIINLIV